MPRVALRQQELFQVAPERIRPFLKWAGGKFRVLDRILSVLPDGARLIEPFTGSAAVSLNAGFETALVADFNADLINLYCSIKADTARFLAEAGALFDGRHNNRESFDALRAEFNNCGDAFQRSVIFVYLNRHGFNGLCRYNAKGKFNVPFGRYTNPGFPRLEIEAFGAASRPTRVAYSDADRGVYLVQGDCLEFMEEIARKHPKGCFDMIFADPPYRLSNGGMTCYAGKVAKVDS